MSTLTLTTEQTNNEIIKDLIIKTVTTDKEKAISQAKSFIQENKGKSTDYIASKFADNIINQYTAIGVASALPGVVPGLGTYVQSAIDVGTVGLELCLMFNYMSKMVYGLSVIYGKPEDYITTETVMMVLGVECGVITLGKKIGYKVGEKLAYKVLNKKIPGKVLKKINEKIGIALLAKYGSKRAVISLGKLIPFGVGAAVGGITNNLAMKHFKRTAIKVLNEGNHILVCA